MSYRDCKVAAEAPLACTPLALPRMRPLPPPMAAPAPGCPTAAPMSAPAAAPATVPTAPLVTALWLAASAGSTPIWERAYCRHTASSPWKASKGFPGAGHTITFGPVGTAAQALSTPIPSSTIPHLMNIPTLLLWQCEGTQPPRTTALRHMRLIAAYISSDSCSPPPMWRARPDGCSTGSRRQASYACHSPYIPTRHGIASIPVLRRGRPVTTKNPESPLRRGNATIPGRWLYPWPHDFNCTSSYGPDQANNGIKPTPDTATRGPEACRPPSSQIGIKRTSSYSFC